MIANRFTLFFSSKENMKTLRKSKIKSFIVHWNLQLLKKTKQALIAKIIQ